MLIPATRDNRQTNHRIQTNATIFTNRCLETTGRTGVSTIAPEISARSSGRTFIVTVSARRLVRPPDAGIWKSPARDPQASKLPGDFHASLLEASKIRGSASTEMPMPLSCTRASPPSGCQQCSRYPDCVVLGGKLDRILPANSEAPAGSWLNRRDQRGGIAKFGLQTDAFFQHLRAATHADVAHGFIEIDRFDVQFEPNASDPAGDRASRR